MAINATPPVITEAHLNHGPTGGPVPRALATPIVKPKDVVEAALSVAIRPTLTLIDSLIAHASGVQDGLAPLFGSAHGLKSAADIPEPVAAALDDLLDMAVGADVDGEKLKRAIVGSGVFHEHGALAAAASGVVPPADLKTLLATLQALLKDWLSTPAPPAGTGEPESQVAAIPLPSAPLMPRAKRPPLPRNSSLPLAQPAELPDPDLSVRQQAERLIQQSEAGLARILLHQAANLESNAPADPRHAELKPVILEIPLATPGGISIAAIRIEREEHKRNPTDREPLKSWKVDLSLAVDPLGPVAARVGLLPGKRVVIGLWCENPETLVRMSNELIPLRLRLQAASLDVGAIDLHAGRPPEAKPDPSHPPPSRLDLKL